MKKILLLGATGSIGQKTLNLVRRNPDQFQIVGASAHSRFDELKVIAEAMDISYLLNTTEEYDYVSFLRECDPDIVLNAVSGFAGLQFSIDTVEEGIPIALSNKESTVAGGEILVRLAAQNGVPIIPIDSEHSAIAQCLIQGESRSEFGIAEFEKIYLTCSGGPFLGKTAEYLEKVTLEQALKHPTWKMGRRITVDSASLANKCLEVFEAMYLFGASRDQIEILIHPQSIVHSMVQYIDGTVMAQMAAHDMELPISYALNFPKRVDTGCPRQDFFDVNLEFKRPDAETFRTLKVLDICTKKMQNFPIVFNAVNEEVRNAFLDANTSIKFTDIFDALEEIIGETRLQKVDSVQKIFDIDAKARKIAKEWIAKRA